MNENTTKNDIEKVPTVSVLMSVYSEPLEWVKQSIDSILTQTFTDFEFIIINDKPDRPELAEFLEEEALKDGRIKVHTNPENIGLTKSLNIGLKLCTGKYIARMDADDISLPERFAKQVAFMDSHPEVIVCGTDIKYFGKVAPMTFSDWIYSDDAHIKAQMLSNSGFAHPTVMIRFSILKENNIFYDERYTKSQDYRLWETLMNSGKFENLPEVLLKYRQSNNQISKRANKEQVGFGVDISKRIRKAWLQRNGISPEKYENLTFSDLEPIIKNKKIFEQTINIFFLKVFYFSRQEHKLKAFFHSFFTGFFFRLSRKDKLRFVAIIVGGKEPIVW